MVMVHSLNNKITCIPVHRSLMATCISALNRLDRWRFHSISRRKVEQTGPQHVKMSPIMILWICFIHWQCYKSFLLETSIDPFLNFPMKQLYWNHVDDIEGLRRRDIYLWVKLGGGLGIGGLGITDFLPTSSYRKISEDSLRASSLDWFFEGSEWWEIGAAPY